jgi:formate/nitrite transporter
MSSSYLKPNEIPQAVIESGIRKAGLPFWKTLVLGFMAGLYISLGAHGDVVVMQTLGGIDEGLKRFMGAAVFPVGLMLVVIAGGELFTGNCLLSLAWFHRRISLGKLLRNWALVFASNLVGSVFLAWIVTAAGLYGAAAAPNSAGSLIISMAESKVNLAFWPLLLRGIGCNILVVLGVWLAMAAESIVSKIFACWFPVMLFVLVGFEHSVANMYFIPAGIFLGADVGLFGFFVRNLLPVTLGNIIGGSIIVPGVYFLSYVIKDEKQ